MRYDVMIHDPVALVKLQKTDNRTVMWTREYVRRFLDVAYSDFKYRSIGLIVQMSYEWGQRVGDMRLLKWNALDLTECRLDIKQSKRGAEVHLPISNNLCQMLQVQQKDFGFQDYVAPRVKPRSGAFTPYDLEEISPIINRLLDEANLPKELTAMDLRRTAVTEMLEAGVDIAGIRQVTGHKNMQSVVPYMVNTFSGASKALAARGMMKMNSSFIEGTQSEKEFISLRGSSFIRKATKAEDINEHWDVLDKEFGRVDVKAAKRKYRNGPIDYTIWWELRTVKRPTSLGV